MSQAPPAITPHTPAALTIAGSDSGAGAGIQADLKTFAACGIYGASVVTAITAQNTLGVQKLWMVPGSSLQAQLSSVLADMPIAAVKTGLLGNGGTLRIVSEALRFHARQHAPLPLVVDTVLASSSGHPLLAPGALPVLRDQLIPQACVITPNIYEAALLLDEPAAQTLAQAQQQAIRLLTLGPQAVLLTGGHLEGDQAVDIYCDAQEIFQLTSERVSTRNSHGTGCTLSAAICAYLTLGERPASACRKAKDYLQRALLAGVRLNLGAGTGPLNHFPDSVKHCSTQETL
ncbi:bifunctional hydroxymethylpyrimidine kinase/phosphomethylpyrimidine kinase [Gilvimarinus sp. SDUM040013]|uniref:hydroxymethylpyrimidine kinase n=1 Tax=Gilvimarinus gilvus TaxID=3058038 RepID=A0ABU4RYQ7_9GAMM|nr:bifunctional hydroxymethylpyrimidine kinase/phosphomethylpyrimidine kinase [Gilvimarinus sp. SDUM040013]MDO3387881.1 bifunctional hydroxymethylpyrimidine kinase/phosphomethylpyrimidine kinase [Gilvimarinus sp. SDUM040013]MDX6848748.1 bifunctional hydroxymethylpyrimidine kinase/phosphomethylpyrimidine kinase [Gilvimarinus sp. SDUM040013]